MREGKKNDSGRAMPVKGEENVLSGEKSSRTVDRERFLRELNRTMKSLLLLLPAAALATVMAATLLLPAFRIYGNSMEGTLENGDVVLAVEKAKIRSGDVIAINYNGNLLIRRVIAVQGDRVNLDREGNVSVNDIPLSEPYLREKAYGGTDVDLPFSVPGGRYFVMGDNRAGAVDSRSTAIGCISGEQIEGKIMFRVWPLNRIGAVH